MRTLYDIIIDDLTIDDTQIPDLNTWRDGILFFGSMFIIVLILIITNNS